MAGVYALLQLGLAALWVSHPGPGTDAPLIGFPLDDAWIHLVYARAAAAFHPFEYNPGQVELGSTSPLWSFLLAPLFWARELVDFPIAYGVKLIGVACATATALGAHAIAERLGSRGAGWVAGTLVATDPWLVFASVSGMEVPLLSALLLGAMVAMLSEHRLVAATLLALAPVTRPESLVIVLPAAILLAARERTLLRRAGVLLVPTLPMLAWSATCLVVSGRPLPNTFYAKHQVGSIGAAFADAPGLLLDLGAITPSLLAGAGAIVGALGAWVVVRRTEPARRPEVLLCMLAGVAFLVGIVWAHDMLQPRAFYWMRYALPAVPLLAPPIALGMREIVSRARAFSLARGGPAHTLVVVAAVLAGAPFARAFPLGLEASERYAWNCQNIQEMQVRLGRWVAQNVPPAEWVATHDAGAIRYFGHHAVLDTLGLNDHRVVTYGGRVRAQEVQPAAWLVMPSFHPEIAAAAALRTVLEVRSRHYTICDCPQDVMIVRVPAAGITP